ncbi:MAG: hypothetical protein ACYC4L_08690 [Chloroflexota bacterium]
MEIVFPFDVISTPYRSVARDDERSQAQPREENAFVLLPQNGERSVDYDILGPSDLSLGLRGIDVDSLLRY